MLVAACPGLWVQLAPAQRQRAKLGWPPRPPAADAEASTSDSKQGEAFLAAMQQVPLVYFQDSFDDNW
jgi:hypothetical protein